MSKIPLDHPTLIAQLNQAVDTIINPLPEGDLNPRWLPHPLRSVEMPTKATLKSNVCYDIQRLQRTPDETIARQLLQTIEQKVSIINRLAKKYQTLSDNASTSKATFRAEQASIFWVSRHGEKNLKLRLAKLKKALKATQASIEHLRRQVDVAPTSLLTLLSQESQSKRQIELMRQKVQDRVDPLRQPQTFCVRTNPMAYTQFEPAPPEQKTLSKTETLANIQGLLKHLKP